jgi:hypothetical protein
MLDNHLSWQNHSFEPLTLLFIIFFSLEACQIMILANRRLPSIVNCLLISWKLSITGKDLAHVTAPAAAASDGVSHGHRVGIRPARVDGDASQGVQRAPAFLEAHQGRRRQEQGTWRYLHRDRYLLVCASVNPWQHSSLLWTCDEHSLKICFISHRSFISWKCSVSLFFSFLLSHLIRAQPVHPVIQR